MYVKLDTSLIGSNKGSCTKLQDYLDKENFNTLVNDKGKKEKYRKPVEEIEHFFNDKRDMITLGESISMIDNNRKGLSKEQDKFYSITYNFSKQELEGRTDEELKEFIKSTFAKDYIKNITGREIDPGTLVWNAKLEHFRTFKNWDKNKGLIPEGFKVGDRKPGDNRHVHITICRMTTEGKKISPLSSNKGSKKETARVTSGFDRVGYKQAVEKSFDSFFSYERSFEHTFKYYNSVKNGNTKEKEEVYDLVYAVEPLVNQKPIKQGMGIGGPVRAMGKDNVDEEELIKRRKRKRNIEKGR